MEQVRRIARWMPVLAVVLFACERQELPVEPFERGDLEEMQIAMGSDYVTQVWYDLGNNEVVSTNNRFDWDLAFDCSDENWIYLNSAVAMKAAPTGVANFDAVTSADDLTFVPDHNSGLHDSLAIGRWWEQDQVWVIDLGFKVDGTARGYRKVQVLAGDVDKLQFKYARLNGSDEQTITIEKDPTYNRTAFSFTTNTQLQIEPPKTDYDLLFTTYTHVFYDPYLPYTVTGALLNPYGTQAAVDSTSVFEDITTSKLEEYTFETDQSIIGYDWKFFSFETSSFIVFPGMNYVVQDNEGFYYKLHFTDFYNALGEKGHPMMQVKRL